LTLNVGDIGSTNLKIRKMGEFATVSIDKEDFFYLKLTQVAKNHFAFVTTLLWH
jgi:hypothetical protein